MKLIEIVSLTKNEYDYTINVLYRQLVPQSILDNPALLAKANEIASQNDAYYEVIDGVHYISGLKSYNITFDNGIYTIKDYQCTQSQLLELFQEWHTIGANQVQEQAQLLLSYKDIIPQGLIGKTYNGTEWSDL
jgi:hypothetical protein